MKELETKLKMQEAQIVELNRLLNDLNAFKEEYIENNNKIKAFLPTLEVLNNSNPSIDNIKSMYKWLDNYKFLETNQFSRLNKADFSSEKNKIVLGGKVIAEFFDDRYFQLIKDMVENYETLKNYYINSKEFSNALIIMNKTMDSILSNPNTALA